MIALLIKASLVIIVMLAFYKLFLEKESFFLANRIYLLSCLIFAASLPFVALPELVENQGLISGLLEQSEQFYTNTIEEEQLPATVTKMRQEETFVQPLEQACPILETSPKNVMKSPDEVTTNAGALAENSLRNGRYFGGERERASQAGKGLFFWLVLLYLFGVIILAIKLFAQILSTFWVVFCNEDKIEDDGVMIVNMNTAMDPCSFFRYVFIHPASYDYDTYEQILMHEKIHVCQRHTIDLLLSELSVILLWFNPFVWLLRKEVEKNIEYQTDDLLLRAASDQKEIYQLNLVKIATYTKPLSITTNYNQSLIKQRISKMNAKKSNNFSYLKYAFVAPLLFGLLLILNKPQIVFAQGGIFSQDTQASNGASTEYVGEEPIVVNENPVLGEYVPGTAITALDDDACTALNKAVRDQDIARITELLKTVDPNCIDPNPGYESMAATTEGRSWKKHNARTPLVSAARLGNLEIAKLLVAAGAKVDFHASEGEYPLMAAASEGHLDFATYLIGKGAEVNAVSEGFGTALHCAARNGHLDLTTYLLDQDAKVDIMNQGQGSALNGAARNGHVAIANLLIARGANVNAENNGQGSPLNAAARNGHEAMVALLLDKGAAIDSQTQGQGSALNAAARNGHNSTIALLLDRGANPNTQNDGQGSALNAAARNGHHSTVGLLLERGADIDAWTNGQGSALNAAARNGDLETVALLIDRGANLNIENDGQGSALNAAARNGHTEVIELLIARGADMNTQSNGQGSALNAAARNGMNGVIELLCAKGVDVNIQNNGQGSALNAAARNGHSETVRLLLANGADINGQTNGQGSALNAAARNGHKDVIELLLAKGADINVQNNGQGSALNAAARNGHKDVIELLLAKGADINVQNNGQGSALNAAARNGHLTIVKLLIANGADVNLRSDGQGTAIAAARRNGHADVVEYLRSISAE